MMYTHKPHQTKCNLRMKSFIEQKQIYANHLSWASRNCLLFLDVCFLYFRRLDFENITFIDDINKQVCKLCPHSIYTPIVYVRYRYNLSLSYSKIINNMINVEVVLSKGRCLCMCNMYIYLYISSLHLRLYIIIY